MASRIWTIGHSNVAQEVLLDQLLSAGIQRLIDIRRYPMSRRNPQFNRDTLASALHEHGIEYVHLEALGGRREPKPDSPNQAQTNEALRGYADHLLTPEADSAIEELIDASILGDGAFKVTWDPDERRVRVSSPDVQGLFAWWLGDDVTRLWRVASRYYLSDEETALLYGDAVSQRQRRGGQPAARKQHNVVEVWTQDEFELWLDGSLLDAKPNPYGFISFVIFANLREPHQFWGISDLEAVREPVRELNRALSQLSMILELSGNPVAVLENVTEAQDIAVAPGAVRELPERARAYLLDLLQGGGVSLHGDYVNMIYRTLHDLGESPRTAFGESRGLSGIALNIELDPLLKKIQRKRLLREAAIKRRNEMILRLLEQYTGVSYAPYRSRVVWGPLLPPDRSRLVNDETRLVEAGIHSRWRAANELGVADPETEFERWREERTLMTGEEEADA